MRWPVNSCTLTNRIPARPDPSRRAAVPYLERGRLRGGPFPCHLGALLHPAGDLRLRRPGYAGRALRAQPGLDRVRGGRAGVRHRVHRPGQRARLVGARRVGAPETIVGSRDLATNWGMQEVSPFGDMPGLFFSPTSPWSKPRSSSRSSRSAPALRPRTSASGASRAWRSLRPRNSVSARSGGKRRSGRPRSGPMSRYGAPTPRPSRPRPTATGRHGGAGTPRSRGWCKGKMR